LRNFRFYQDINEHEKWLATNKQDGRQLILENEDLSFLSISDVNLSESIFKNCNLQRVVFKNVSLDMVYLYHNNFSYADIQNITFNNSILKNNIFEGCIFTDIQCSRTTFNSNNFKSVTFEKNKFDNSHFELNRYVESHFTDVKFINTVIMEDKTNNCKHVKIDYIDSYISLTTIENSSFYNSMIESSYINIEEKNNIYIKNKPDKFFTNYKNNYTKKYTDVFFDSLVQRLENFENLIMNKKYTKEEGDQSLQLHREFINQYISVNQIKYQALILENQGGNYSQQLTLIKDKISYLEPIIKNRANMMVAFENRGKKDE
jgi:uncharacterized protein YjbI with pentapeptide repeats